MNELVVYNKYDMKIKYLMYFIEHNNMKNALFVFLTITYNINEVVDYQYKKALLDYIYKYM